MESNSLVEKWPRSKAIIIREVIHKASWCGCGTSAEWECVLELLAEAENHAKEGFFRDKWFEFGAKVLDSLELLDHGGNIGNAWLTDKGRVMLEFLQDFGTERHCFDDGSGHPVWSVEYSWKETEDPEDWYSEWARSLSKPASNNPK